MADVDNVKTAEQFNRLFSERRVLAAAVTREMRNQLELATQIAVIVGGMKPEEITDKLAGASKAMQDFKEKSSEAGDQAEKAMAAVGTSTKGASKGVGEADKKMKLLTTKFPALASVSAGAFNGLIQGFKNIVAGAGSAIGMVGSFAGGVMKVGKSIASIPLKIFSGLIDMATDFPVDSAFAQALENLRKESGDFKTDVSKNVMGAFQEAKAGITGTGLSTFRVLGTFAQQLEHFSAIAKNAGPQFHQFGASIAADAGTFVGLQKGLGVADDQIKSLLDRATVFGTSWQTQMLSVANYSLQMGESFGISQKLIAKDINAMIKDVKNFGGMTQKAMAEASVYTKKLGIEIKSIAATMDKFATFEDAATSAAMLSQAFGTSIDSFKLMEAQSPAEKLDILRKSMLAAGKSTENMSWQDKKLLAQTVGLDEATSNLAFSEKNRGVSLDQIKKKSGEAENAPLKQAQAMEKLAASIERVVMTGQMFKGGFIDQFIHGFELGVKNSPAFIEMILTLRNALQQTMLMGRRVGMAFINLFPGATPMLKAMTHGFDGFRKVLDGVEAAFKVLFVSGDVRGFVENLQSVFGGFFTGTGVSAIGAGAKQFFGHLAKMFASGLKFAAEELTKGLTRISKFITDYVKDPKTLHDAIAGGADGAKTGFQKIIEPLVKLVQDPNLWKDLWTSIKEALSSVWGLVKKWITSPGFLKVMAPIGMGMFALLAAPTLIRGAAGGLASVLVGALTGVSKTAGDGAIAGAGKLPIGGKMMTSLFGNPYVAAGAFLVAMGVAGVGMSKGVEKFQGKLLADTKAIGGPAEKQIGSSLAGIVQLLSFGSVTDEAAYGMAKSFAKFTDDLFKQVDKIFGPSLGGAMKERLMIQFDFLTHLGDLIRNIMSGNIEGIGQSIGNILGDAFKMGINSIRLIFMELPTALINWIVPAMDKLSIFLYDFLSDKGGESIWTKVKPALWQSITDIGGPLWNAFKAMFFAVFTKLIPSLLVLVGTLVLALGKAIGDAFTGLGKIIWNALISVLTWVAKQMFGVFGSTVTDLFDKIKKKISFGSEETASATVQAASKAKERAEREHPEPAAAVAAATTSKGPKITMESLAAAEAEEQRTAAERALETVKVMQELQKVDIQKLVNDTGKKLSAVNMDALNVGLLTRIAELNTTMTAFSEGLKSSAGNVEARLAPTLKATADIIASVKELDKILASGDATKISVSKNLSKLAANAGLGGNERYTIQNKGIQINLDLKIVMNAEELEEALVLRTKSLIKEAVKTAVPDMTSDDTIRNRIRNGR